MASYDDNEREGNSIEINHLVDGYNDNLNVASYSTWTKVSEHLFLLIAQKYT